jgi:membrane protease YdiL (CAAX protease family)
MAANNSQGYHLGKRWIQITRFRDGGDVQCMVRMPPDPDPHLSRPNDAAGQRPPVQDTLTSLGVRERREGPAWSGWDVVLIAIVTLFAVGVFALGALAVASRVPAFHGASPAELARDPRIIVPAQSAAYGVALLFMWGLLRSYGRRFWSAISWEFPYSAWVGYLAGGVVLAFAIQFLSAMLPLPRQLPIEQMFRNRAGAYIMAAFGTTLAPLVEEIYFRGFLFGAAVRRLGPPAGVALTAAAFALIHQSQLGHAWSALLLLFLVGLALTIVRARSGSVAAGFLMHAAYNTTLFAMLYFTTGHFRHLERMS